MTSVAHGGRIVVTAKGTDLSRCFKAIVELMAPEEQLELHIDQAGLERIGVSLTKGACQRSCCVVATQLSLLASEAA